MNADGTALDSRHAFPVADDPAATPANDTCPGVFLSPDLDRLSTRAALGIFPDTGKRHCDRGG
jgi:hypothetical protein